MCLSVAESQLSGFRIGEMVDFRVHDIDGLVVVGQTSKSARAKSDASVPAIAYLINTDKVECITDSVYPGIVSLVDLDEGRVEVVLSTWLINATRNRKENRASALELGQEVGSVAIAVRPREFAVVAFRGHAAGRFGVVPTRRSFNDILGGNAWSVGQRNQVTLRQ